MQHSFVKFLFAQPFHSHQGLHFHFLRTQMISHMKEEEEGLCNRTEQTFHLELGAGKATSVQKRFPGQRAHSSI